ncbi:MAG TPA: SRPBCC family protein [Streptosporangiaceae bacterium]
MVNQRTSRDDPLTQALGWLSLGLAIPPMLRPGGFVEALGLDDTPGRRAAAEFVGVRELASAATLLGFRTPAGFWARVGGDVMDLAMLTKSLVDRNGRDLRRTAAATAAVAGILAVDAYAAVSRSRSDQLPETVGTVTISKPPEAVYQYWRQMANLAAFMAHLDEVRVTGERTSHWRTTAAGGRPIEWDAEITEDIPGQRISWRSGERADIPNEGTVEFRPAPGDRGTEVHVRLRYTLPGGYLGQVMARLLGEDPHQQLDDDLRRLKQVMETGEVVRSEGAPGGKRARHEFPQHPARPLSPRELEEVRA